MSKEYELNLYGQPSLYKPYDRRFKVFFSEPNQGINEKTGILLLINGYGANPASNVYKKMRREFADKYNLITVQCEYFGMEFMQVNNSINLNDFTEEELKLVNKEDKQYKHVIKEIIEPINEQRENMNDMGPIQAIDNITSIISIIEILKDNNLKFNKNKIIIYGYSHGAYIGHLCNLFSPNLFSAIIDNSGYIYPSYLIKGQDRKICGYKGLLEIHKIYKYIIKDIVFDKEFYDLRILYSQIKNKCRIISLQGDKDELYDYKSKVDFIKNINNATIELITNEKVDGVIFKSNIHGLNADFINIFEYIYDKYNLEKSNYGLRLDNVSYATKNYNYKIDNELGVPILKYESK